MLATGINWYVPINIYGAVSAGPRSSDVSEDYPPNSGRSSFIHSIAAGLSLSAYLRLSGHERNSLGLNKAAAVTLQICSTNISFMLDPSDKRAALAKPMINGALWIEASTAYCILEYVPSIH